VHLNPRLSFDYSVTRDVTKRMFVLVPVILDANEKPAVHGNSRIY